MKIFSIPLSKILVQDRAREDFGDLQELADSIREHGLLQPVLLDDSLNLLAGERRFRAHQLLQRDSIDAILVGDADSIRRKEIELEENVRRKQFTWPEESRLTAEIDALKREKHGSSLVSRKEGWSQSDTAAVMGVQQPAVAKVLQAARIIELVPELAAEPDRKSAVKKFNSLLDRLKRELAVRRGELRDEGVFLGDCRTVLAGLPDNSVDCVIMDPPYGTDIQSINVGRYQARLPAHFDDSETSTLALLEAVLPLLRRVLRQDGHLYTFGSIKLLPELMTLLTESGFTPDPIFPIWLKSNDSLVDYDYRYAGRWEPIIFCTGRSLTQKRSNVFDYSSVPSGDRLNIAEKPVPLLEELIRMSTQEGEVVLDPFAGSGSLGVAARNLGRKYILIEQDHNQYNGIITRLQTPTEPEEAEDDLLSSVG